MIYLSGAVQPAILDESLGVILTPYMGNRLPDGAVWAADTGCYSHSADFDVDWYLRWLRKYDEEQRNRCMFANAPDVPYDSEATTKRSAPFFRVIRDLGFPVGFCVQDGHTIKNVPWREFDALFVGGSVRWKTSEEATVLKNEAQKRGKWTHMGKVNTKRRFAFARAAGYDSADGTYLKYGPDVNAPKLQRWIADPQMGMGRLMA